MVEGTKPQSRSKVVEAPQLGNIHRKTVESLQPPPEDHQYSSVHRPEPSNPSTQPPSGPFDLADLKSHQVAMLSPRQKRKHKRGE